jgi:hypothetical protein
MDGALSSWVLPLVTGLLVAVFAVMLAMQWRTRRKVHQLWWTVGFSMYSAAALLEAAMQIQGGWTPLTFRLYALTSASLVAILAHGSLALLSRDPWESRAYLAYNVLCFSGFGYGVLTTKLVTAELTSPRLSSYAALGGTAMTFPRVLSLFLTIPGTFVLLGCAFLSILRFMEKKEFAYRMWANVLIATATVVIASGGGLAKAGHPTLFYLTELGAAILFFSGFLVAGSLKKGADKIRAGRAAAKSDQADGSE